MKDKPKYFVDEAGLYYKAVGAMIYWLDEDSNQWTFFCKSDELEVMVRVKETNQEQVNNKIKETSWVNQE